MKHVSGDAFVSIDVAATALPAHRLELRVARPPQPSLQQRIGKADEQLDQVGLAGGAGLLEDAAKVSPHRAAIFMNLMPIIVLVFSAVVLGEQISLVQVIGTAMVVGGVVLTTRF